MPIRVTIDARQLIDRVFETGNQHEFHTFLLRLPRGERTLTVRAGDGTSHRLEFAVPRTGHRWGVLTYWAPAEGGSPSFQWTVVSEPPLSG